jgi:hypothetical protein
MGNSFAYLAISVWPLIVLYLLKRYGFTKGVLFSFLGAYMFLPAGFAINLPGIPAFNKFSVTSMTLIMYLFFSGKRAGFLSLPRIYKFLVIGFIVAPFLTVFSNPNSYMHLPGLTYYDGLSDSVGQFLYILPFIVGFKYFRTYESQFLMFKYFAISAVIYALLALYEIRMSPQLHNMVYGFFPHSWLQQVRSGGFRAIVFMGHGLLVALFLAIGLGFWAVIRKNRQRILPVDNTILVLFVIVALIFMKSLAALIFGLFLFLMITYISTKKIHQASLLIALLFMTYPITSSMGVFPHDELVDFAYSINPERGQSLEYRFKHEGMLLDHASIKSLFGWGGWGRNRVRDPETGEDLSVTDGKWILSLGVSGWFGFLMEFLLVVLPLWVAYKVHKQHKDIDKKEQTLLAAHALIISIILLDQMPNSSINPLYLLLVGALLGRAHQLQSEIITKKTVAIQAS